MKRRPHHAPHTGLRGLLLLAGTAWCLLLAGAPLPARQAVAPACSAYSVSKAPVSTHGATIRSDEPGRSDDFGDPWANGILATEYTLEEADFPDESFGPAYLAAATEAASAPARSPLRPSGFSRAVPLYCLFEVYRL